ncbi:hypothetical protein HB795_11070 [Listeria welshimeri]|nr:hypothetical protein [Listeria welshimeri]
MTDIKIALTRKKFKGEDVPLFLDNELELKNKTLYLRKMEQVNIHCRRQLEFKKAMNLMFISLKRVESVLGENDKLNAIALAMEAGENQQKIKVLEKVKLVKAAERERIVSSLEIPNEENLDNYFTKI